METLSNDIADKICEFLITNNILKTIRTSKIVNKNIKNTKHYKLLMHERHILKQYKGIYSTTIAALKLHCHLSFVKNFKNLKISKANNYIYHQKNIYNDILKKANHMQEYICAYGDYKILGLIDIHEQIGVEYCALNISHGILYLEKILNGRGLSNEEINKLCDIACVNDNLPIFQFCIKESKNMKQYVTKLFDNDCYNIIMYVSKFIELSEHLRDFKKYQYYSYARLYNFDRLKHDMIHVEFKWLKNPYDDQEYPYIKYIRKENICIWLLMESDYKYYRLLPTKIIFCTYTVKFLIIIVLFYFCCVFLCPLD